VSALLSLDSTSQALGGVHCELSGSCHVQAANSMCDAGFGKRSAVLLACCSVTCRQRADCVSAAAATVNFPR
jgi:hypothetical protein